MRVMRQHRLHSMPGEVGVVDARGSQCFTTLSIRGMRSAFPSIPISVRCKPAIFPASPGLWPAVAARCAGLGNALEDDLAVPLVAHP
jgi:hypothetical protein